MAVIKVWLGAGEEVAGAGAHGELWHPTNHTLIAQISEALRRTLISVPLSFHAAAFALPRIDECENE